MPTKPIPDEETPLEQFSQCHAGIRQHLDSLGAVPELLEAAQRARTQAAAVLKFFQETLLAHHEEEERELFPAVLAAVSGPDEEAYVRSIADRLTREHRRIEAVWARIRPGLKDMARGHDSNLDATAVQSLVATYRAHADYEEQVFLPLAHRILSRDGNQMAALGISLHMRHVMPDVMNRFGHRI